MEHIFRYDTNIGCNIIDNLTFENLINELKATYNLDSNKLKYRLITDLSIDMNVNIIDKLKQNGFEIYKCNFMNNLLNEILCGSKERKELINIEFLNYSTYTEMRMIIISPSYQYNNEISSKITEIFKNHVIKNVTKLKMDWYTRVNSRVDSYRLVDMIEDTFYESSYPTLLKYNGMENLVDSYLDSNESVLILFGDPGTGKTRFIRYILRELAIKKSNFKIHTYYDEPINKRYGRPLNIKNVAICYTTDLNVLENDIMFISFINESYDALVLEDIDANLNSRLSGNHIMHKFLTSSDGLISNHNKKIIFSTNLPDTNKIDPALIRPGRCFGTLKFRKHTYEEAVKFMNETGNKDKIDKLINNKTYSLAALYNIINGKILSIDSLNTSNKQIKPGFK